MTLYKTALRQMLRPLTRTGIPGRSVLVEALRPFIVQEERVVTKAYHDLILELDLNDLIQRQMFFDLYEREDINLLRGLVAEGDVVFDIGGNVGLYTIALANKVGPAGKVHVFEPIPENIRAIQRNVSLNTFEDRVIVNPIAVADSETILKLYIPSGRENAGWASIVPSASRKNVIEVQSIKLDAYIRRNNINNIRIIKMDIEGAELCAMRGMRMLLGSEDAPMIYFEINPYLLAKQGINAVDIKQFLVRLGYRLFALENNKLVAVSWDTPENGLRNILATKRPSQSIIIRDDG